ncbi:glycosyltransferase [Helicobacter fennelliae]
MHFPLVSIVTIVYNDITNIAQTMDSVISQDYPSIEYILIDGASSDGTKELIESKISSCATIKKKEQTDSRLYIEALYTQTPHQQTHQQILHQQTFSLQTSSQAPSIAKASHTQESQKTITFKFLSQKDSGIYDAMNKGVDLASGEWCNFMNSGDRFYANDSISQLFSAYNAYISGGGAASIIYGDSFIVYSPKHFKILRSTTTSHKYRHHFIHQSAFIDSALMKHHKYDTSFKIAGDTDFFAKAYNNGAIFKHFEIIIASFNVEGISSNLSFLMFKEDCKIGYKYNKFFPFFYALKYIFWVIPRVCIRNAIPKSFRNRARVIFGAKTT